MTSLDEFEWPWLYSFPPFFTLQPNAETRRKQLNSWCQLVIDYFKSIKKYSVSISSVRDPSCPLFHNKAIGRSASSELIVLVFEELHRRNNLEWTDKSHNNARIIWRTNEEWADLIARWARSSGHSNTVCTLFELTDSDGTEGEAFHGLDEAILLDALYILQKQGKAQLMGSDGVKFFL